MLFHGSESAHLPRRLTSIRSKERFGEIEEHDLSDKCDWCRAQKAQKTVCREKYIEKLSCYFGRLRISAKTVPAVVAKVKAR